MRHTYAIVTGQDSDPEYPFELRAMDEKGHSWHVVASSDIPSLQRLQTYLEERDAK